MSFLNKLTTRKSKENSRTKPPVYIVSGLPRSGTSMMMKMLSRGGLSVVMDSIRQADEDNPNGYFEIELSKKLKEGEVKWVYEASGKVVKVISYLLEYLPDDLNYYVVFMEREIKEVLASQHKMLDRRNEKSLISDEEMTAQYNDHLRSVKYWLPRQPNIRVLYVNYNSMVSQPEELCNSIATFLELPLDVNAMCEVPNQSLYRNRS
jgi:Sulfotransferase domain